MGAGGQMNVSDTDKNILDRVPVSKPPFSLSDLKKAIPPHCFKRSLVRSFSFFFRDLVVIYSLYRLAANYIPTLPPPLSYIAWLLYWFFQGSVLMGFWILGHECGHHAFSDYKWVDNAVGFFTHSICLTPYFSFKYSHRGHHTHTNSIEYDEVYVPKRKSDTFYSEFLNCPSGLVGTMIFRTLFGLPLYLFFNIYGRKYVGFANHFNPKSPIFKKNERVQILLSDAGILTVLYMLYRHAATEGVKSSFCMFGAPLILMSGLFITWTYLNHTHLSVAHYDSSEWDWLRGGLGTIDRDFGLFFNEVMHDAPSTHVLHHLFPGIPHYHAVEATKAVKPILGDYYKYDDTPVVKALWRETKECIYVEPDQNDAKTSNGVYWFYK